jgi:prolyl 3-hydroxylase /prolyl 3,4-dihydroxylase
LGLARPEDILDATRYAEALTTSFFSPILVWFVMAKTHPRSPSPEPKTSELKRLKIAHPSSTDTATIPGAPPTSNSLTACFTSDLFSAAHVGELANSYAVNQPFKHALVEKLFQDDLLQKVKDECLGELHFTEKETDIYKVQ